ncbi:hypothetical protein MANES_11G146800v8 [Manihot esculenta]|uniref:Uncharacterized protein n=1 Tax=Manihot esculenta TaxID=3983 RepID=A0A2C9V180_MANES|nr:hypothetical protein MANES_11G146800v8 [Manihot esculenta]
MYFCFVMEGCYCILVIGRLSGDQLILLVIGRLSGVMVNLRCAC